MPRSENYSTDSVQSFKSNFREHLPAGILLIKHVPFGKCGLTDRLCNPFPLQRPRAGCGPECVKTVF